MRPRIWLFGISKLLEVIRDVAADYDPSVDVRVIAKGFEEAVQAVEGAGGGAPDVVVSAGSNGSYLKARLAAPVILITPTGFDVMHALERARRIDRAIGIVMHGAIPAEMTRFLKAFDAHIHCAAYTSAEDAETQVLALKDRGVKVIVGPGLVTELAAQAKLAAVFLYSRTSVTAALARAVDVARASRAAVPRPQARHARPRTTDAAHPSARYRVEDLQGECNAMRQVRETVRRYGASDATVLLLGETGTGKEVAAQALHRASARHAHPFLAINCGALPETLLESELFGYEEGAFTGARRGGKPGLIESADRGTFFLDEIAEMPIPLQSRLLRVVQEREVVRLGGITPIAVDVRFIAATHRPLADAVADRTFRADLFYRLNILRIDLPALRERGADIDLLAEQFMVQSLAVATRQEAREVLKPVRALLAAYRWPGNVRELQNVITRIAVECESQIGGLTASRLGQLLPELDARVMKGSTTVSPLRAVGRRSEAEAAIAMLNACDGDRARAALALGISKTTLWRRLRLRA